MSAEMGNTDGARAHAPRLEVSCQHRFGGGFEVDFEFVSEHATTALFGPSGAGKTSLLMMIAGFVSPNSGRIAWNNHLLVDTRSDLFEAPEARRLGVVFQDQRLFPHLTVEANLLFGRRRRAERSQREKPRERSDLGSQAERSDLGRHAERSGRPAFDRMVSVLDLADLLRRRPDTLSGGERQRVALGRALMSAPDLLLLDEPVAAVDEPHRDTILGYVARVVHEWSLPMLYVSHHRAEVQRLADWVIAVDGGRVTEQGPPDLVLGTGAVVAAGEPVNLLRLDGLTETGGGWFGTVAGHHAELRLPACTPPASAPAFVQFAASDVMLASGSTTGLSARNRLPATVTDLVPRAGRVFVALRVGEQRLWAEVTPEAVADLELVAGKDVTCLIKSAALRLVE